MNGYRNVEERNPWLTINNPATFPAFRAGRGDITHPDYPAAKLAVID